MTGYYLKPREENRKVLYEDFRPSLKGKVELVPRKDLKKGEIIPIISDSMFHTMFCHEKRLKYTAKLLSYLVDASYETLLSKLRFSKTELNKEKEYEKSKRCDCVALFDQSYINLEVNCNQSEEIMERNLDYAFKLYSSGERVGRNEEGRFYDYRQVIQININNFRYEGLKESYYLTDLGNAEFRVTNKLLIFQIFLPNVMEKCYTKGVESLSELERYLMTMVERDVGIAKGYGKEDKVMSEYVKEAEEASIEVGFGESYDHEWALKDLGRQEGREEGEKTGRKSGLLQAAKEMLKRGIDDKTILECTGVTRKQIEES